LLTISWRSPGLLSFVKGYDEETDSFAYTLKRHAAIVRNNVFLFYIDKRVRKGTVDRVGLAIEPAPLGEDDYFYRSRIFR